MSKQKQLYLYPYEHANGFIDRTKSVFSALGFSIHPFRSLFRFGNISRRKSNWVVLNWYEDQPFRQGMSGMKRVTFILGFIVSLWTLRLFTDHIIWVRHNFKPHNTQSNNDFYRYIVRLMRYLSDRVITLEPTDILGTVVAKHPLYKGDEELLALQRRLSSASKQYRFLYFGSIKPYKRLDMLLHRWPADKPLTIKGYCADPRYTATLNNIIAERELQVHWENRFLDDDELEAAVANTEYVILPHDDNAMISSGTFYMALSLGANVLCLDSVFARYKAGVFNFVKVISTTRLPEQLDNLEHVPSEQVIAQAMAHYNDRAVQSAWCAALATAEDNR